MLDEVALNILRPLLFLCIWHLQNRLYCCFKNALKIYTFVVSVLYTPFSIFQLLVTNEQMRKENATCKIKWKMSVIMISITNWHISFTFPIKRLNKASKCTDTIFKKFVKISVVWNGCFLIGYGWGFFVLELYEFRTYF